MTERPILFSAPMVRAILEGRKTQTRRIIKPQPPSEVTSAGVIATSREGQTDNWTWLTGDPEDCDTWETAGDFKTRFAPGDELWVREAFSYSWAVKDDPERRHLMPCWYWADGNPTHGDWSKPKPSIHMPRWASRITLKVTGVKIERLRDIGEEDAKAEGIRETLGGWWSAVENYPPLAANSPIGAFYCLWTSINGAASWEANPWVAAISFERIKP